MNILFNADPGDTDNPQIRSFCDDGFYYRNFYTLEVGPVGRWWWSKEAQQVCVGPVKMHTGIWAYAEIATREYLKLLNKAIVDEVEAGASAVHGVGEQKHRQERGA